LSKHDFAASANPILYLGASFIDSEKDTWNICPIALEEAIIDRMTKNKKIKAIITVNLYGMPYKVDEVHAIAEKYGILF
jgi:dTDP-4-amino-4,6-dideoxygalactose transaminase